MNVKELKAYIEQLPDTMPIYLWYSFDDDLVGSIACDDVTLDVFGNCLHIEPTKKYIAEDQEAICGFVEKILTTGR